MFRVVSKISKKPLYKNTVVPRRCFSGSTYLNKQYDVGFIGLGQMGFRMAQNLVKGGKSLLVYDLSPEPLKLIKSEGVAVASTPKEITEKAQTIITMLPSSPHVQSVYLEGNTSLVSGLTAGSKSKLFIDCSTIDPNVARNVAKAVTSKCDGVWMLDAPVSGGIVGAQQGTLTFMVGGEIDAFNLASPILRLMGKNVIHCGGIGNGQVAKVCNNLVLGISMIATSEAMNLGTSLGMDAKVLAGVINTSSGRCWSSDSYNPVPGVIPGVPSSNDYQGGFAVDLMAKDLGLAVQAAQTMKEPLLLGGTAHQTYNLISKKGYGRLDFSAIYKYLSDGKKDK